jgi:hypothetical protein
MDAQVVRVAHHEERGLWWADSEDIDGFTATIAALVYEVSISSFGWSVAQPVGSSTTVGEGAGSSARGRWQALAASA